MSRPLDGWLLLVDVTEDDVGLGVILLCWCCGVAIAVGAGGGSGECNSLEPTVVAAVLSAARVRADAPVAKPVLLLPPVAV